MRKSSAILLALILGISLLTACGGGDGNTAVSKEAGFYALDSFTYDGETYSAEDLKELEMDGYYIELNADGKMELDMGDVIKGTWKNGVISYKENGEDVINNYTLNGDYLTIKTPGADFVFKRNS